MVFSRPETPADRFGKSSVCRFGIVRAKPNFSDGHGFGRVSGSDNVPTGATVPNSGATVPNSGATVPANCGDGHGFGNRADGDRRTRSPSRSADGHADGFAVAIFRQGNGQQAATAPRPICRERFGTVTGSDGNGQRFATMPPTVTGSGGQPWRQSRRRGDGFGNGQGFAAVRPAVATVATVTPTGRRVRTICRQTRHNRPPWRSCAADGFAVRARPDSPPRPVPFLCAVAPVPPTVTGSDGNGQRFATMPPNAPQPPAVAFPPFGRVRARPDSQPRPVPSLCAVATVTPTGQPCAVAFVFKAKSNPVKVYQTSSNETRHCFGDGHGDRQPPAPPVAAINATPPRPVSRPVSMTNNPANLSRVPP